MFVHSNNSMVKENYQEVNNYQHSEVQILDLNVGSILYYISVISVWLSDECI